MSLCARSLLRLMTPRPRALQSIATPLDKVPELPPVSAFWSAARPERQPKGGPTPHCCELTLSSPLARSAQISRAAHSSCLLVRPSCEASPLLLTRYVFRSLAPALHFPTQQVDRPFFLSRAASARCATSLLVTLHLSLVTCFCHNVRAHFANFKRASHRKKFPRTSHGFFAARKN